MSLDADTILKWATLANLLLVPILVFLIKMRDDIRKAFFDLKAHAQLDDQKFATVVRDIDRHERDIEAAHKRLDDHGAPSAAMARTRV